MSAKDRCGYCNALSPQLLPCRPCRKLETTLFALVRLCGSDAGEGIRGKIIAKLRAADDLAYVVERHECDSAPDFRGSRVKLTLQQALEAFRKAAES